MSLSTDDAGIESLLCPSSSGFDGQRSQFPNINLIVDGGWWNGQLTVLNGLSSTGKTSLLLQELLWLAKRQDVPSFLLCVEMSEAMMERKIFQSEFSIPMLKLTHGHLQELRKILDPVPLFLGSKCRMRTLTDLESTVRAVTDRYGVRMVAIDNINHFARSAGSQNSEIAACAKLLKDLTVDLNVPIIAIAQPRLLDHGRCMMTTDDIAWFDDIEPHADTILLLHRRSVNRRPARLLKSGSGLKADQSGIRRLEVAKTSHGGGGDVYLHFDGPQTRFPELSASEEQALVSDVSADLTLRPNSFPEECAD